MIGLHRCEAGGRMHRPSAAFVDLETAEQFALFRLLLAVDQITAVKLNSCPKLSGQNLMTDGA